MGQVAMGCAYECIPTLSLTCPHALRLRHRLSALVRVCERPARQAASNTCAGGMAVAGRLGRVDRLAVVVHFCACPTPSRWWSSACAAAAAAAWTGSETSRRRVPALPRADVVSCHCRFREEFRSFKEFARGFQAKNRVLFFLFV